MQHLKPRYPLSEAFALLGFSRAWGFRQIKDGRLRAQKDGRRSYITAGEIDRYVGSLTHCCPCGRDLPVWHKVEVLGPLCDTCNRKVRTAIYEGTFSPDGARGLGE